MRYRVAAAVLLLTGLFPRLGEGQTLSELERPLLSKGQIAVSTDYGLFSYQGFGADVDFGSFSYFEPAHHVLLPAISFGGSKNVQFNLSGTYLLPTTLRFQLFPGPGSALVTHEAIKSFSPEVVLRRGNALELHLAGTTARSRYDAHFPAGNGTATIENFATDGLRIHGTWLPHPDVESRPRRADLDGLLGPLMQTHRTAIQWDGLWRRYRSTGVETDPFIGGTDTDTIRSTDSRLQFGAMYGAGRTTQLSGDVYWQPPFDVSELQVVHGFPGQAADRLDDYSRRLSGLFGWRFGDRWRLGDRLEARAEAIGEGQSVSHRLTTGATSTFDYWQRRFGTGLTFLSKSNAQGEPLSADLAGLYGPVLEKRQLRLDAEFRYMQSNPSGELARWKYWRAGASVGLLSSLEGSVYVGGLNSDVQFFVPASSVSASLRLRPSRWFDAYATLNYHPTTWVSQYPAFVLPQGSVSFAAYQDLLNTNYDDDASLHFGVRIFVR